MGLLLWSRKKLAPFEWLTLWATQNDVTYRLAIYMYVYVLGLPLFRFFKNFQ